MEEAWGVGWAERCEYNRVEGGEEEAVGEILMEGRGETTQESRVVPTVCDRKDARLRPPEPGAPGWRRAWRAGAVEEAPGPTRRPAQQDLSEGSAT